MVFKTPKNLEDLILHWWKIVDQPSISREELENFIAFELFTLSLEETKKSIEKAIIAQYLTYDPISETLQLGDALQKTFNQWQSQGEVKWHKMEAILNRKWRQPLEFDENDTYTILLSDLIDSNIKTRADTILSSAISLDHVDFDHKILGTVRASDENRSDALYRFEINRDKQSVRHDCPEFIRFSAKRKIFCPHLYRIVSKLFVQHTTQTLELLTILVHEKEGWQFLPLT